MTTTLYSREQAAQLIGIRPVTLDRLRKAGRLNYRLIGSRLVRFTPEDIQEYLQNSKRGGGHENTK